MINKFLGTLAVTAAAVSTMAFAAPAEARGGYYDDDGYYQQVRHRDGYREYRRGDYYREGRRYRDHRAYRDQRRYRDRRYRDRYHRGCDRGTGGTIVGAIAGGLLGHEAAGRRGDKTAGVIIGGAVGALAGRAIDGNC